MDRRQIFQERLRLLRADKGLSQRQAAETFGISKLSYQKYEMGWNMPSFEVLNALADFFGVSIDYLFGRTNNPNVA